MEKRILKLRGLSSVEECVVAFCLELNLGAQGSSMEDARTRLDRMVQSYVEDLVGEDAEHIKICCPGRRPWSIGSGITSLRSGPGSGA